MFKYEFKVFKFMKERFILKEGYFFSLKPAFSKLVRAGPLHTFVGTGVNRAANRANICFGF